MRYGSLVFVPTVAAVALLAGCGQPKQVFADHGYVRLAAVKGNPAVAYFTLHGGTSDATLISVTSPAVIKTELHESMGGEGMGPGAMASMAPVQQVTLPADGKVEFKPGGKHVMLYDVNPSIQAGGTIPLIFTFADNLRIQIDAPVIAAGSPPPKG